MQSLVCRCLRFLAGSSSALCVFAVALILSAAASAVHAQTKAGEFDASNLPAPVDLGGTWMVHGGDDPAYARPDFDDSQWQIFDPHSSVTALFPATRPDVIWYRQRVRINPAQTGLALKEQSISHAFEVYVNGERILESGQVAPFVPYTMEARIVRRIPDRLLSRGYLVIALRVRISKIDWAGQNPGYYAANLTLGQEDTLKRDSWLSVIGENLLRWVDEVLIIGVGFVALVLFAAQAQPIRVPLDFCSRNVAGRRVRCPEHHVVLHHSNWLALSARHVLRCLAVCLGVDVLCLRSAQDRLEIPHLSHRGRRSEWLQHLAGDPPVAAGKLPTPDEPALCNTPLGRHSPSCSRCTSGAATGRQASC